jgi:Predicted membrane protein
MVTHATATPIPIQAIKPGNRVSSIDLLRGLVMIIMALDHVRDYFHVATTYYDPTDLAKTTPELFFTRFITHFCAPTFMLLSGTSAWLVGKRKGKKALSRFLLTRGIWLVILEMTVVSFGWYFSLPRSTSP